MKTNADNHSNNKSTIANAFARAREEHFDNIRNTICKLLDKSMRKCLNIHDERHQKHKKEPHDYGWVLWYDGAIAGMSKGEGAEVILADASDVPTQGGWFGAVVANMKIKYLNWDYEIDIMNQVIPDFERALNGLFKDRRKGK